MQIALGPRVLIRAPGEPSYSVATCCLSDNISYASAVGRRRSLEKTGVSYMKNNATKGRPLEKKREYKHKTSSEMRAIISVAVGDLGRRGAST